MITLKKEHIREIESHSREGYPNEVCGIIMGTCKGFYKTAIHIKKAVNLSTERSHDRYELDPKDLLRVERESRARGLEIVGFYHSHPDHPDIPSEFDRARAWPAYSYIIASVSNGRDVTLRSWVLDDETLEFEEEKIVDEECI